MNLDTYSLKIGKVRYLELRSHECGICYAICAAINFTDEYLLLGVETTQPSTLRFRVRKRTKHRPHAHQRRFIYNHPTKIDDNKIGNHNGGTISKSLSNLRF